MPRSQASGKGCQFKRFLIILISHSRIHELRNFQYFKELSMHLPGCLGLFSQQIHRLRMFLYFLASSLQRWDISRQLMEQSPT
mmetsp:Transcript_18194/g.59790  ORF Transcript_18194/g.59790 Transcript_18194/m.59790 type:complete len:83 (-) Transcript_18194:336-584(-)